MKDTDPISRRTLIKITGAAGVTAAFAGCADEGPDEEDEEEPAEDPAEDEEDDPAAEDEDEPEDEEDDPAAEDEEDEDGEDDEENGNGDAIEPGTTIEFDAQTAGWVGIEPEEIADEENPTLTLQEGEEYEIGWEEGDGSQHNIELVDEDDEVVDDYETDETDEGGDDQFIEFEATDEIAEYVCRPHEGTMRGEIEIEGNGNGEDDEEEENGDGDEENDTGENGNDNGNGDEDDE